MSQESKIYCHAGAQAASLVFYFLLAGKSQGYCSFTSAVTATALQYFRSNQINDQKKHFICRPAMVFIAVGCLFSRTGVKVGGLSLAYFATSFETIHYHRPKRIDLPPFPVRKGDQNHELELITPKQTSSPFTFPRPFRLASVVREEKSAVGESEKARAFVAFYRNEEKGKNGFLIDDILKFKESEVEQHHNFIQFLFPTYQRSNYCSYAPLLNAKIVQAFLTDSSLRAKQKEALALMVDHYGLKLDLHTDKIVINPSTFAAKQQNFFINGSHNLLRITRILSSLTSLGQPELAVEFYNCLKGLSEGPIPRLKGTLDQYWLSVVRSYL
ncbi:MAG: hypothetical protein KFB95_03865 [Simkaniaceae bacterium]|nr:MAG: hypothetical protein KFB95_03865 [Simkaniaceae bacterium]